MAQPGDGAAPDNNGAAAGYGHQRASHADRERVIGMFETAFAAGLLSKDDLDRGVNWTLASRTYAELAAAAAGLRAQPASVQPRRRPARSSTRPENAAAWAVCGLIMTAFLTIVVVPSGTTRGVVAITAGIIYTVLWLLAGIMVLAARHGRPHLPARHSPDDQVGFGAAGHGVRQRRLRWFMG
jgi:DUF1707 SHOCT-like domain